jgi:hypothetical protein
MADQYDAVNQLLAEESNRIGPDLFQRTVNTSVLLDMVKEGDWPAGMGSEIEVMTWSRMLPADATTRDVKRITWDDVTSSADDADGVFGGGSSGTNGSCLPPTTTLPTGFSLKSYKLQHAALESAMICVNDLRNAHKMTETLTAIKNSLTDVTQWVMLQRLRQLYLATCTSQVLVKSTSTTEATTMPSGAGATPGVLKQGLLQKQYRKLMNRGANNSSMITKVNGRPIFPLLISMEASRTVLQETNYRDDIRWNPELVGHLTKALGSVSPPIFGFLHIDEVTPDRWNWENNAWTWVPPYTYELDSGSGKYVMVENPDYDTATWEDTWIFHPEVMEIVFPGSISAPGGGTQFEPIKYRGDWRWVNIKDRTRNIDGNIGNFRGNFMFGAKPVFTDYGSIIRHARCELNPQYGTCPTGSE